MTVDALDLLRRGGVGAVRLLDYAVYSRQLELVFAFLVGEYRVRPSAGRALALYDSFCAPGAPGRIRADSLLPPRHLRLQAAIQQLRQRLAEIEVSDSEPPESARPAPIPARELFDEVVSVVTSPDHEAIRRVRDRYDPDRGPVENLPGGRMTEAQRVFVERVWRGQLRPRLVRDGFARASTIGS